MAGTRIRMRPGGGRLLAHFSPAMSGVGLLGRSHCKHLRTPPAAKIFCLLMQPVENINKQQATHNQPTHMTQTETCGDTGNTTKDQALFITLATVRRTVQQHSNQALPGNTEASFHRTHTYAALVPQNSDLPTPEHTGQRLFVHAGGGDCPRARTRNQERQEPTALTMNCTSKHTDKNRRERKPQHDTPPGSHPDTHTTSVSNTQAPTPHPKQRNLTLASAGCRASPGPGVELLTPL